ncbi:MAG: Biotin transport system permease protein [Candidatus Tokpelaia hoelldobleri]|uniref:Biotin transport system permease protein n=1 Tax=Candidatus Tokpelaia hoelldobleri TaxID=1902579 RepID=A0A1U9JSC8_9HYPH|nr:MAG: Biotin transport system permease protein [Candidatus Tokpelaia hoelldoblerii]
MIVTTVLPAPSSFLHRINAGYKFLSLFCISLLLFFAGTLPVIATTLIMTIGFYKATHLPLKQIWQQLRPIRWLLLFLAVFQLFYNGWYEMSVTIGRLVTMLLLAGLIMLTTTATAIMASFERSFQFLRPFGANPAKISLVLSLTLRFIPMLAQISQEVREAQKARGLEYSFTAIAIPVLIRTLKTSGEISAAIEARCYDEPST